MILSTILKKTFKMKSTHIMQFCFYFQKHHICLSTDVAMKSYLTQRSLAFALSSWEVISLSPWNVLPDKFLFT